MPNTYAATPDLGPSADEGLRCQLAELMYRLAGVCDAVRATYGVDLTYDDDACRGEAEGAYQRVLQHLDGTNPLAGTLADLAQRAAALMRRLDGRWEGDGCLYACATPAFTDLDGQSTADDGTDAPVRCTWTSLNAAERVLLRV